MVVKQLKGGAGFDFEREQSWLQLESMEGASDGGVDTVADEAAKSQKENKIS